METKQNPQIAPVAICVCHAVSDITSSEWRKITNNYQTHLSGYTCVSFKDVVLEGAKPSDIGIFSPVSIMCSSEIYNRFKKHVKWWINSRKKPHSARCGRNSFRNRHNTIRIWLACLQPIQYRFVFLFISQLHSPSASIQIYLQTNCVFPLVPN